MTDDQVAELDPVALACRQLARSVALDPAPRPPGRGHGSPYDRGRADYYYGRPFAPHYFEGATYQSRRRLDLTPHQLAEYRAGWDRAEADGDRKEWG